MYADPLSDSNADAQAQKQQNNNRFVCVPVQCAFVFILHDVLMWKSHGAIRFVNHYGAIFVVSYYFVLI